MYDDRMTEFELAVQRTAAITDTEQAADICQATVDVLVAFDHWRGSSAWRDDPAEVQLVRVVSSARDALAELPVHASLDAVLAAVTPLLNPWWPSDSGPAAEAESAVEQLRYLAMTRTRAIADCRMSVGWQ
jgi:hypothetical protein